MADRQRHSRGDAPAADRQAAGRSRRSGERQRAAGPRPESRRQPIQSTRPSNRRRQQQADQQRSRRAARQQQPFTAAPGGRYSGRGAAPSPEAPRYTSASVRELREADREKRVRKSARRYLWRAVMAVVVVVAVAVGAVAVYNSPLFTIRNVTVNGVEHLTSAEMAQLAAVPADTTLMKVDADKIANRLKASAWVQDVKVNRIFPDTLELDVTEREVAAIVEIPTNSGSAVKSWAIAKDHTWLMPIPEPGSEAAKTTSAKIYEDADAVLHVKDVPLGTKAEIGKVCTDANVNNALDIVSGMTTSLADQVVEIMAAGTAETTLVLDNGVEVAFGKAEDIRDKERVVKEILEQNPDGVSYINVRMVETPTWRAI